MRRTFVGCVVALLVVGASVGLGQVEGRLCDFVDTDTRFELNAPDSLAEWQSRAEELRRRVKWAAGLTPELPRAAVVAEVIPRWEDGRCRVSSVRFESAPGLYIHGNLYAPLGSAASRPVVLSPHGHWSGGRFQNDADCSVPARCVALARAGAIVFAYDMLGFGDAQRQFGHREARFESAEAEYYGLHSFALQTWNSMRALDFMLSLPEADHKRVAISGASGGGTQSFVLACIDPRVSMCIPVNMVSATMQGGCPCENAPGLRWGVANPELAATIAPRPLLLVSASGDWTRETPQREFPYVRQVYELFGAGDQVANAHFDAPHNYNAATRRAVYAFVRSHWLPEAAESVFDETFLPPVSRLPFYEKESMDVVLPDAVAAWERLRGAVEDRVRELEPPHLESLMELRVIVREALDLAAGSAMPDRSTIRFELALDGMHGRLQRDGRNVRFRRIGSEDRVVLFADPRGLDRTDALAPEIAHWRREGYAVVMLEPFGSGDSAAAIAASSRGKSRYFTTFHRSAMSEGLEDLSTALAWFANDPQIKQLAAVGRGWCGSLLLGASARMDAAVAQRLQLQVDVELEGECFGWPNFGRVGGMRALVAVQVGTSTTCRMGSPLEIESWARPAAAMERRLLRVLSRN